MLCSVKSHQPSFQAVDQAILLEEIAQNTGRANTSLASHTGHERRRRASPIIYHLCNCYVYDECKALYGFVKGGGHVSQENQYPACFVTAVSDSSSDERLEQQLNVIELPIPATSPSLNASPPHGRCGDLSFPVLRMHGTRLEGREKARHSSRDSYFSNTGVRVGVGVITVLMHSSFANGRVLTSSRRDTGIRNRAQKSDICRLTTFFATLLYVNHWILLISLLHN